MDNLLKGFLRSDHAGEVGAVYIYKGILKISKDPELVNFSKRHLATEESHLQKIEGVLPKKDRSKLVWLWKVAGFLLGFLPTLFGPKIVFATIVDGAVLITTDKDQGETHFRSLEDLQLNLNPQVFWRVHRSFLVNINKIKEVVPWFNRTLLLKMLDNDETEVPVSRSHSRRLKKYLNL